MSYKISDKKKISLFRKSVQILTAQQEDFHMHFTKGHIRVFNSFVADNSTYLVDFMAQWFSKFTAPDPVKQGEMETLQICCKRDDFLQAFNFIDDTEVEFILHADTATTGAIKVIKTRDILIVEANMPFEIERQVRNDEMYEFPMDQLLIHAQCKQLRNLKGIFKSKSKQEVLQIDFSED